MVHGFSAKGRGCVCVHVGGTEVWGRQSPSSEQTGMTLTTDVTQTQKAFFLLVATVCLSLCEYLTSVQ